MYSFSTFFIFRVKKKNQLFRFLISAGPFFLLRDFNDKYRQTIIFKNYNEMLMSLRAIHEIFQICINLKPWFRKHEYIISISYL